MTIIIQYTVKYPCKLQEIVNNMEIWEIAWGIPPLIHSCKFLCEKQHINIKTVLSFGGCYTRRLVKICKKDIYSREGFQAQFQTLHVCMQCPSSSSEREKHVSHRTWHPKIHWFGDSVSPLNIAKYLERKSPNLLNKIPWYIYIYSCISFIYNYWSLRMCWTEKAGNPYFHHFPLGFSWLFTHYHLFKK